MYTKRNTLNFFLIDLKKKSFFTAVCSGQTDLKQLQKNKQEKKRINDGVSSDSAAL